MKYKCDKCQGKGGWYKRYGFRLLKEIFVSCIHCKGKGKWYDNQKSKVRTVNELQPKIKGR